MDNQNQSPYECSICLLQFVTPKIISCGHTFCQRCLENTDTKCDDEKSTKTLQCPTCCKRIKLPPSGSVRDFPLNFAIQQTIDRIKLQNHCPQHDKYQDLFCRSCENCICAECFLQKHSCRSWSRRHVVTSSTILADETITQLKEAADGLQVSQYQNMILDIEEIENRNKENAESVIREIKERREQLIEEIRLQAEELIKTVEMITEDTKQELGKIKKDNAKMYLEKMKISKRYIAHANEIRKHGLTQATFNKARDLLSRCHEMDGSENDEGEVTDEEGKENKETKTDTERNTEAYETKEENNKRGKLLMTTPLLKLEDFANKMEYVENPKIERPMKVGWIQFVQRPGAVNKFNTRSVLPSFITNVIDKIYQFLNWE